MASEVTIPRLGWNMEEGTFIGWLKADGDHVAVGDPLFTLEGDKAAQDIESLEAGVLRIPPDGPTDGQKIAVGALIGYLVAGGEPAPFELSSPDASRLAGHNETAAEYSAPPATRALSVAMQSHASEPKLRISPRARRVAREFGVDTSGLRGSGQSGRIIERDIRAAATTKAQRRSTVRADKAAWGSTDVASADDEEMIVTPTRRTIAERMVRSAQTCASVTLTTTVDAANLVNLRQQFKVVASASAAEALTSTISITDIIIKLTALALEKHRDLNARWNGETIVVSKVINIGIAVDTDAGLLVPVIRAVPNLTLRQLAARSRELIERARTGALSAADMQGGTFTVTNLGALGIETFTPLINLPECAILGVGRIQKQVVVDGNQFVARERLTLSLTFDHRVVDGAPAARFLQSLSVLIENPSPWLVS
jgi:pyruvate dehydrogenase E2 component (dihydrolipoamide acetyltransferase)